MSGNKANQLPPYQIIKTQSVSSGSITSDVSNIYLKDNVTLQCIWDGTLAGSFDVQSSVDYNENSGSGEWDSLPLSPAPAANGSPNHGTIELNQLGAKWLRVVFTQSAGSGNLTVYVMGKVV